MVAQEFGWTLALVVPGLDAVLVRDDLLHDVAKPTLASFERDAGCLIGWSLRPATAERAGILLDYSTWRRTRSEAAARAALSEQLARYGIDFTKARGNLTLALCRDVGTGTTNIVSHQQQPLRLRECAK